jgi:protein-arginine kinase activator protein McsA
VNDTSWVKEGIACAEVSGQHGYGYVTFTIVERLTATQVVCASGNRYRREDLRKVGGEYTEHLCPTDNRHVRNICAQRALRTLRNEVDKLLKDVRYDEADSLAALDHIERLVAETRATIADPTRNG